MELISHLMNFNIENKLFDQIHQIYVLFRFIHSPERTCSEHMNRIRPLFPLYILFTKFVKDHFNSTIRLGKVLQNRQLLEILCFYTKTVAFSNFRFDMDMKYDHCRKK